MSGSSSSSKMNLLVLGSGGVGKSAFTTQFVQRKFIEFYDPTIQDSFNKVETIHGRNAILTITDTAGQIEFSQFRMPYIRNADGVIIIFSVTDADSMKEVMSFFGEIEKARGGGGKKSTATAPGCPVLLFGNKTDLVGNRVTSAEEGDQLARNMSARLQKHSSGKEVGVMNIPYLEGSSTVYDDVEEAWHAIMCKVWAARGDPVPMTMHDHRVETSSNSSSSNATGMAQEERVDGSPLLQAPALNGFSSPIADGARNQDADLQRSGVASPATGSVPMSPKAGKDGKRGGKSGGKRSCNML